MKKYALLTILLLSPLMIGWTLNWGPVTKYTDNTTITRPVTYTVWDTGTQIGSNISAATFVLPYPGSGVVHIYEVAAVVDNVASMRAGYTWTSPLLVPQAPVAISITP